MGQSVCVEADTGRAEARPLTSAERRLLDALLAHDFPGVEQLRLQAHHITAYPSCKCGCGSIGFEHPDGVRPGPSGLGPLETPLNPIVVDSNGEDVGGLILFVRAGLLDDLEVYSFGPDPLALPDPTLIRLPPGE